MNELTRQPATLQEVADAAGVHRSTASRALNPEKAHLIGQDVVERVQAAARRIGYQRDVLAAGLRTKRSRLIGVVVPDMANLVFAPILSAIETVLAENGYSALIANAGGGVEQQIRIVDQLIAHRVEGIVLATAQQEDPVLTRCLEAGVPAVLVNRAEAAARASTVISDDINGMRLAVEHLVGLGHRRIGHIAGPRHLSTGFLRRQGFEQAMAAAGLDAGAVAVASAYTRDAGRVAAAELLDSHHDLTAVATANDLLALGLYLEMRARGLALPRGPLGRRAQRYADDRHGRSSPHHHPHPSRRHGPAGGGASAEADRQAGCRTHCPSHRTGTGAARVHYGASGQSLSGKMLVRLFSRGHCEPLRVCHSAACGRNQRRLPRSGPDLTCGTG